MIRAEQPSDAGPAATHGAEIGAEHLSKRFRGVGQDVIIGVDDLTVHLAGGATLAVTGH